MILSSSVALSVWKQLVNYENILLPSAYLFAEAGLVGWYSFLLFQAKYFSSFRTTGFLVEVSEWFDLALLGALLLENAFFSKLSFGTTLLVCFLFIFAQGIQVFLYVPSSLHWTTPDHNSPNCWLDWIFYPSEVRVTQPDTLLGALHWGTEAGTKYLWFEELSWLH